MECGKVGRKYAQNWGLWRQAGGWPSILGSACSRPSDLSDLTFLSLGFPVGKWRSHRWVRIRLNKDPLRKRQHRLATLPQLSAASWRPLRFKRLDFELFFASNDLLKIGLFTRIALENGYGLVFDQADSGRTEQPSECLSVRPHLDFIPTKSEHGWKKNKPLRRDQPGPQGLAKRSQPRALPVSTCCELYEVLPDSMGLSPQHHIGIALPIPWHHRCPYLGREACS